MPRGRMVKPGQFVKYPQQNKYLWLVRGNWEHAAPDDDEKIRRRRMKNDELGAEIGALIVGMKRDISGTTIGRWFAGDIMPTYENSLVLADFFNVDRAELLQHMGTGYTYEPRVTYESLAIFARQRVATATGADKARWQRLADILALGTSAAWKATVSSWRESADYFLAQDNLTLEQKALRVADMLHGWQTVTQDRPASDVPPAVRTTGDLS